LKEILNSSELSLEDPFDQQQEKIRQRSTKKEMETKLHNSFTGPYPLDPTEFGHKDKGESYFAIFNSIK